MPFITSKVSCGVSAQQEQQLKQGLGQAIAAVPGKSEQSLLVCLEQNCHLWLRGENELPIAYIEVSVFGNEQHAGYEQLTRLITVLYSQVLHISAERIYIRYTDIPAWGVAGMYIDRKDYR